MINVIAEVSVDVYYYGSNSTWRKPHKFALIPSIDSLPSLECGGRRFPIREFVFHEDGGITAVSSSTVDTEYELRDIEDKFASNGWIEKDPNS